LADAFSLNGKTQRPPLVQSLAKLIKFCVAASLVIAGVTLAVQNRGSIDLNFYPLPYVITMPLFLFAIIMLVTGILLGWVVTHFKTFHIRRAHKAAGKRVAALENELTALRSEQLIRPAALQKR
jgi:uncharacterized integral membrane protein